MARYIFKRFLISLLTVWLLVTVVFVLVRLLPGDPFSSEKLTPAIRANLEAYYGFDQPLHMQYFRYIGNLLRGDLGFSLKYQNMPVSKIIADSFPYSADLGIRTILFASLVGISLGVIAGLNRGKPLEYLCIVIAVIGISLPDFITGSLLQYFFGLKLGWFPVALWRGFRYTVLPTLALSFYTIALLSRIMRTSMLDVTGQDYIRTARAKGLSTFRIVWRHQLRNAILPVVTVLGPITAAILTGTFVIESIYAIPGMGKFYVLGVQNLDYTVILGLTAFYGIFLIAANFVVDILYGIIDPRIALTGRRN
ncbi:ABC transporter permease [Aminiphilus sp.]|uniref:ABC transporter permease n=1 Tax=Aminiphilus sp. TaxID=1872488 RepID=UPI00262E5966|nr:ABC transporter permease [Aminiphilus sp.]